MSLCYDLHSHTMHSDGMLTPQALVQRAAEKGVDVLAVTDHDMTAGVAAAIAEGARVGVTVIPGVEISVTWQKRLVHIVGLWVDPAYAPLQQGLNQLRETRNWRAEEIGKRFDRIGIDGVYEGARALAVGDIISRTHFARYLLDQGVVKDIPAAFKRYLKHGKPCHVRCEWASLEEAVAWINGAGGQAVIAHPARYQMSKTLLSAFLNEFREVGGVGIEVVSSSHSADEQRLFAVHAQKSGLLGSAGSDFHAPGNKWVELGQLPAMPQDCTPIWQHWSVATHQTHTIKLANG